MLDTTQDEQLLRRFWYAAAFSSDVVDRPVGVTILGERLVVSRLDGTIVVSGDRCTHRGAPLSEGTVVDHEGAQCLRCPYHALHFDARGAAVHLPGSPGDRLPSRLKLEPYASIEKHGIVWVCLSEEPLGGVPDWSANDMVDAAHFQLGPDHWESMASRISENFNDLAHFATVHAATFGDEDSPEVPAQNVEVLEDGLTLRLAVSLRQLDRVTVGGSSETITAEYLYTHVMPFSTELRIQFEEDRTEWIQMTATPTGPTSAMVFMQNTRDFDLDGDLVGWRDFQSAVNEEDRFLLELLEPAHISLDGSDSGEVALSVDAFTIAFRRVWRDLLAS